MMDLAELGITKEELQERVVTAICERLLSQIGYDSEGDEYQNTTPFADRMEKLVKERLDQCISNIADKYVLPNVTKYVENLTLQETNRWGEKTGKAQTFIEYMTARAEAYLTEEVNYEGKSKNETRDSYSWSKSQTRIAHMVNQHLHYSIKTAMEEACKVANAAIVGGLQETVKIKLDEISKGLKVSVALK